MRFSVNFYKEGFESENALLAGKRLRIYTGAPAAARGTFPAGTVLATITLTAPLLNASSWDEALKRLTATKASGALQDVSADAGGTAGCFAIDDGGVFLADGTIGLAGSGADMIVDQTTVAAGAPFIISAFTRSRTISV